MPEQLREQLVGAAAHNGSLQQTSVNWRVRSVWMLAHCVSMFESAAELIELSLQIETSGPQLLAENKLCTLGSLLGAHAS